MSESTQESLSESSSWLWPVSPCVIYFSEHWDVVLTDACLGGEGLPWLTVCSAQSLCGGGGRGVWMATGTCGVTISHGGRPGCRGLRVKVLRLEVHDG